MKRPLLSLAKITLLLALIPAFVLTMRLSTKNLIIAGGSLVGATVLLSMIYLLGKGLKKIKNRPPKEKTGKEIKPAEGVFIGFVLLGCIAIVAVVSLSEDTSSQPSRKELEAWKRYFQEGGNQYREYEPPLPPKIKIHLEASPTVTTSKNGMTLPPVPQKFTNLAFRDGDSSLDRDLKIFSGIEGMRQALGEDKWAEMEETLKFSPNSNEERMSYANIYYIGKYSGIETEALADNWEDHRNQYAVSLFGHAGDITEAEFYAKIGEKVRSDFNELKLRKLVVSAAFYASEVSPEENANAWEGLQIVLLRQDGYNPSQLSDYADLWRQCFLANQH